MAKTHGERLACKGGNTRRAPKWTFKHIQEYLDKVYNTKFGHGALVQ